MTALPGTDPGPIGQVQKGMTVVDARRDSIGKVDEVQMGDPDAVTEQGQGDPTPSFPDQVAAALGADPDVSDQRAAHLRRLGYLKIDTAGLFARDVYATADQIDRVEGDTVQLTVTKDDLTT